MTFWAWGRAQRRPRAYWQWGRWVSTESDLVQQERKRGRAGWVTCGVGLLLVLGPFSPGSVSSFSGYTLLKWDVHN